MASREYAECLCNPTSFQGVDEVPGVPDGSKAFRYHVFSRGSFVTGLAGVGWVVADSYFCAWSGSSGAVNTSDAATTGSLIAKSLGTDYSVTGPLDTSNVGYYRLVGMCVRAAYDGPLLDTEGHSIIFAATAGSVEGATEFELLSDTTRTSRSPVVAGEWMCAMHPGGFVENRPATSVTNVQPIGVDNGWFAYTSVANSAGANYQTGIMVHGAAGDKFIYSVDAVYEWMPMYGVSSAAANVSTLANMARTAPSDPVGLGAIKTMANRMPLTMRTKADGGSTHPLFHKLVSGAENLLGAAVTVAKNPVARNIAYRTGREIANVASRSFGSLARTEGTLVTAGEAVLAIAALERAQRLHDEAMRAEAAAETSQGGARSALLPLGRPR